MTWLKFVCVFFALCSKFVNPEVPENQPKNIIAKVKDVYNEDGTVTVNFGIYSIDVWAYGSDTANAFYTAVGCKFAKWTMIRLFELVKLSPTLYYNQSELSSTISYDEIFVPRFKGALSDFNKAIEQYVGRFVEVLNGFIDTANSNITYYKSATLTKTLLSLMVKAHYHLSADRSETEIVSTIAEEMTRVQKYLSTNCGRPKLFPTRPRPVQLTGYWRAGDDDDYSDEYLNMFLSYIWSENIGVHTETSECFCGPLTLLSTDIFSTTKAVSTDIANTLVKVDGTNAIKIEDLRKQMETSWDVDLVFLYQDAFLTAVVKMIFFKVSKVLEYGKKSLNENVKNTIRSVRSRMSTERTNYPKYLIDGFDVLTILDQKELSLNDSILRDLTGFSASLNYCVDFSSLQSQMVIRHRITENINVTLHNIDTLENLNAYLSEILNKLSDHLNDFKCFYRTFKSIHLENDKYYVPFRGIKLAHDVGLMKKAYEKSRKVCDLLINVNSHLFSSVVLINRSTSKQWTNGNSEQHSASAWNIILQVKNLFLLIISLHLNNLDTNYDMNFLKIAYNVAVLLLNRDEILNQALRDETAYIQSISRVVNTITTEFDSYGIKYCSSPKLNQLMFNNINFFSFGGDKSINSINIDFIDRSVLNDVITMDNLSNFSNTLEDVLNVRRLYLKIIKYSKTCQHYGVYVKFFWEGKIETIQNLFQYSTLNFSNSDSVFRLHDIFFKFHIGVFYYEIQRVLKSAKKINQIRIGFDAIVKMAELLPENFPQELHTIIHNIKDIFDYPMNQTPAPAQINKSESYFDVLKSKTELVDEQFQIFNIILNFNQQISNKSGKGTLKTFYSCINFNTTYNQLIPPVEDHEKIKDEFTQTLKRFNNNILKIHKNPNFIGTFHF